MSSRATLRHFGVCLSPTNPHPQMFFVVKSPCVLPMGRPRHFAGRTVVEADDGGKRSALQFMVQSRCFQQPQCAQMNDLFLLHSYPLVFLSSFAPSFTPHYSYSAHTHTHTHTHALSPTWIQQLALTHGSLIQCNCFLKSRNQGLLTHQLDRSLIPQSKLDPLMSPTATSFTWHPPARR